MKHTLSICFLFFFIYLAENFELLNPDPYFRLPYKMRPKNDKKRQ